MRIAKPSWVVHQGDDEKKKKSTIFSIHVHPDCSRLATGSLDAKIKIWSTLPILQEDIAENEANPKLLCTLALHNGPVLTVRWAHHGRYLASGSDDGVVMIWDLDPSGGGKVWGSDDVNVENWKPLKRLVGHESDVADLAWNMDDSMIASVGLDSTVFIWDGYTFDRIRRIDQHQGFVKGVCWDPVGQYLATQSDDKSVKIWSTEDWSLVAAVEKPFQSSPANTFFRRLSWSPDGSFIAASNAMNGPVFVAAVIDRDEWESDISFVGHENTIQVAAFNPRLFYQDDHDKQSYSTMLALGADDNSISIWKNTRNAPLVVVKDIFERQILDLSWSNDGLSLYGCSSDGTICAISFDKEEVPELSGPEAAKEAVRKYGYEEQRPVRRQPLSQGPAVPAFAPPLAGSSMRSHFGEVNILPTKPLPQKVTIMPNGKRRIQPALIATLASTEAMNQMRYEPAISTSAAVNGRHAAGAFAAAAEQPLESQSRIDQSRHAMLMDADGAFADGDLRVSDSSLLRNRLAPKRHARTLGDDAPRETGAVKELRPAYSMPSATRSDYGVILPVPNVQSVVRVVGSGDASGIDVTAQNDALQGPTIITYRADGKAQWSDVVEHAVLALSASAQAAAVATEDNALIIYSSNGVRKFSRIPLDSPVSYLDACHHFVMAITARGALQVWDVRTGKLVVRQITVLELLATAPSTSSTPPPTIIRASVRPNGVPLLQLSSGVAYAYAESWEEVCSPWWMSNSSASIRSGGTTGHVLASLEEVAKTQGQAAVSRNASWWDDAFTLGHLETRLRACELLHSPSEYREYLREYARRLGQAGFGNKIEELIKSLHGPIYHRNGAEVRSSPTVCGLSKRDLLDEVLGLLSASGNPTTSDIVSDWQMIMMRAGAEL